MIEDLKIAIANAIEQGDLKTLDKLFGQHPEMLPVETGVGTWLHYVAQDGNLELVKYFVARGIGVNAPDPTGFPAETPLSNAVMSGSVDVVRWLLEQGAKSDCVATPNGTGTRNFALGSAISRGRLDLVQLLVEYGANVNVYYAGKTPLVLAEAGKHKDIVAYLRSKGAKLPEELGHGAPAAKPAPKPKRKK